MTNKFRNATNTRYLMALFYETTGSDKTTVVYTLKDQDHKGYPSLYRLYMEKEDLTEYLFAQEHLDGWEHWQMLCECEWFKPYVQRWRTELDLLHRARALNNIKQEASNTNSRAFAQLNKFLVEGGWKEKSEKGRPSKDDVKKAAKEQADTKAQLQKDWEMLQERIH